MKLSARLMVIAAAAAVVLLLAFTGTNASPQDDIEAHRFCTHCSMDRKAFGFSRMLIVYEDGSKQGVCSLHCAVIELAANKDRKVKALLVADRESRALIGAEQAVWVAGGSKRGVMTERPSWAFSTKAAAEKFVKEYGGAVTPWVDVLAAAREEAGKGQR